MFGPTTEAAVKAFQQARGIAADGIVGKVTWINIDGLGDIEVLRVLGSRFNLHPLALEDVLDTGQRPKVEQYDNYLFIVAHMLYLDRGKAMCGEQVSMFLGKHFLITLQEEAEFDVFEPVRARIRSANGTIRKTRTIWPSSPIARSPSRTIRQRPACMRHSSRSCPNCARTSVS